MAGDPNCPACRASTKRVVDAYFDGYLAGAVEMAASDGACEHLVFCTPHELMATRVIAAMAAKLQGAEPRQGSEKEVK